MTVSLSVLAAFSSADAVTDSPVIRSHSEDGCAKMAERSWLSEDGCEENGARRTVRGERCDENGTPHACIRSSDVTAIGEVLCRA